MYQPTQMVGLFGLPTQKEMEKVMKSKMGSSVDELKTHISKELKIPMVLVSVASVALVLYLLSRKV